MHITFSTMQDGEPRILIPLKKRAAATPAKKRCFPQPDSDEDDDGPSILKHEALVKTEGRTLAAMRKTPEYVQRAILAT